MNEPMALAVMVAGLILGSLLVLSYRLWRESERRAQSLRALNDTVNAHLHRELSLRHANERIMEFSRDILCSIDARGILTSINPAAEEILGYRPDQLIGKPYNILIPPEDHDATAAEMRRLIGAERRISNGFRNHQRHRDGQIVTLSWTAEWSEEDQALFCVGRDMTDQLAAETLIRERDQFFSLSPDMFCIADLNNHFFEVNRAFEKVLGYERGELLGASYLELIHSEDRARVEAAVASMLAGNTISHLQIRAISKDNTEHWLELSAILTFDDLIYVAARDTTEMRRTQEKLRESERLLKIAERAAGIGGWVMDLVTGQMRWSHAMFDIHELPFGELPTFEEALEFYTPGSREIVSKAIETCIQAGIPFDEELQIRTRNGHLRWVRTIGQAVRNDEGQMIQIQGALQDITAPHQIRAELERSNRELQDFAFVASHDLQEPLRKIQAFSDWLLTRSDQFGEQEQDYLRRMQSAAKRMQSLIQDLLTYSRVTTRAQPLTVCDTNQILAGVLQDMETIISRENADLNIMPLPAITGDATQLRQVFQNLLSNAVKFHKKDMAPKISIRAENGTSSGWTLVFSDRGIGFDERYAGKLFHPFQKLHREKFPGTGIGMAIVKKILDRHGATVTVESEIDQGTRFRIFFPTGNQTRIDSND
jgi:PAS domain S-box-containing protein